MFGQKKTLAVVIILIFVLSIILIIAFSNKSMKTSTTQTVAVYNPVFSFNQTLTSSFFSKLAVPTEGGALLQTFSGSQTIYLADDQALDYTALLNISASIGSTLAGSEASEINNSISSWGGFDKYWNPAFIITGDYPSVWTIENGTDQQIGSIVSGGKNYSIKATVFSDNPNFDYYNYADQDFYYTLWNLHTGNYSGAENAFTTANRFWNGYGFHDNASLNSEYDSYKLALDLIVWKSLEQNPSTTTFASSYITEMKNVTSIMSLLQASDGGVWTNYVVNNGQILFGKSISHENGETTSLFVIAADTFPM
jgi:hypothetical protein